RGVDVDDSALGVVDEHRLTEPELRGERLPFRPVGHDGSLADDTEFVAVAAVRGAEDAEHVVVGHGEIETLSVSRGCARGRVARPGARLRLRAPGAIPCADRVAAARRSAEGLA